MNHYQLAVDAACSTFPGVSRDAVTLNTSELDICQGHLVEITPASFDHIIDLLSLIEVIEASPPFQLPPRLPPLLCRKPIIYLYSPADIDVSVNLSLSPEWRFSAIYPIATIKQNQGEHIQWNIRTHQDGSLTEKNTGLDVSYLFWEAE